MFKAHSMIHLIMTRVAIIVALVMMFLLPVGVRSVKSASESSQHVTYMQSVSLGVAISPQSYDAIRLSILLIGLSIALTELLLSVLPLASKTSSEMKAAERLMERNRIARELHDNLFQGMQALILRLEVTKDSVPEAEPLRTSLQVAIERAHELLVECRDRIRDLRTQQSEESNLPQRLSNAIEQLSEPGGPMIRLSVSRDPHPIAPLVSEELVSFGKEALWNAVRHSKGTAISCQIRDNDNGVVLSVSDNGQGMPSEVLAAKRMPGHWGLVGLQERATNLGATMSVRSNGSGTSIELAVPGRIAFSRRRAERRSIHNRLEGPFLGFRGMHNTHA